MLNNQKRTVDVEILRENWGEMRSGTFNTQCAQHVSSGEEPQDMHISAEQLLSDQYRFSFYDHSQLIFIIVTHRVSPDVFHFVSLVKSWKGAAHDMPPDSQAK